jgi:hypothetical protein
MILRCSSRTLSAMIPPPPKKTPIEGDVPGPRPTTTALGQVAGDVVDVLALNDETPPEGVFAKNCQLRLRVLFSRRYAGVNPHPERHSHNGKPAISFGAVQYTIGS